MSKRVLSLVLALVMVLGTVGSVFAAESGNEKVDWLVDQGLVVGDAGGLRLADPIKRSEVAVMVVKALDQEEVANSTRTLPSIYSDMSPLHWANGFVNVASSEGFISGYTDGSFKPDNNISYAEMASMLVRVHGGMTEQEIKDAVWPTTWLIKAIEFGIFDGVAVADYDATATREDVFEMVYNVVVNKQIGNYSIIKGIVLENYRVETLDKDEVVVEFIKEIQRANQLNEALYERGDQENLVIPAKVGDVEDLLGKVVDFTLDKDGNVVAAKVDNTYKYEVGKLTFADRRVTVGTTRYTVELPERYRADQSDERIFRTYVNNESFAYVDAADEVETAEYARVTVKNGKVLFIDAFNFDDIAPVKEVKNDGKIVYVYDDENDAQEKRVDFNARTKVVSIEDKVMNVASLEDIEAYDVIHYNKDANLVFVRLDAAVEGEYEKFSTATVDGEAVINLHVDGEKYPALRSTTTYDNRRAVYSYDGEEYNTLVTGTSLESLRKEDVTLLLDMNGNVQLVTSDMVDPSFLALVVDVIRGEVRFAKADGTREDLVATFDTKISIKGSTRQQNLNVLSTGDLVKVTAKDGEIVEVLRLAARGTETDPETILGEDVAFTRVTKDYITLVQRELINSKTKFFIDVIGGTKAKIKGIDIDTLLADYNVTSGKAYIHENEDGELVAIVFTDISAKAGKFTYPVVRVVDIYGYEATEYEVVVENDGGVESTHAISRTMARELQKGDIVELKLTDDDDKDVAAYKMLIEADAKVLEVVSVRDNQITLKDKANEEDTLTLLRSADVFGDVRRGQFVSIHINTLGDIDVIEVRNSRDYGLALWSEIEQDVEEETLTMAEALLAAQVAFSELNYHQDPNPIDTVAKYDAAAKQIEDAEEAYDDAIDAGWKPEELQAAISGFANLAKQKLNLENADDRDKMLVAEALDKVGDSYEVPFGTTDIKAALKALVEEDVDNDEVTVEVTEVEGVYTVKLTAGEESNTKIVTVTEEEDPSLNLSYDSGVITVVNLPEVGTFLVKVDTDIIPLDLEGKASITLSAGVHTIQVVELQDLDTAIFSKNIIVE